MKEDGVKDKRVRPRRKEEEVEPLVWTTYSLVCTVLNPVRFQAKLQCGCWGAVGKGDLPGKELSDDCYPSMAPCGVMKSRLVG